MTETGEPLWRLVALQYDRPVGQELTRAMRVALSSEAVQLQRSLFERLGLRIDPVPFLWKQLPGPYLRLFFRVEGENSAVEEGQVVALVLLHDLRSGRTLYAHPVHAGPQANPLLKHLYGPMAAPKAQDGANGDRATLRLLEHKRAMWEQFLLERERVGPVSAGERWRERYQWALVRLYFCERCPGCRWGSPHFDGTPGEPYRAPPAAAPPAYLAPGLTAPFFDRVRAGAAWAVETAYARRGGFTVSPTPRLAVDLPGNIRFVVCPTDVEFIQPGALVGLALYADAVSADVKYAHVLTAGPEPEPALLFGDRALGLPPPQPGPAADTARESYAGWRAQAWSRFWLCELEEGLEAASRYWLEQFWHALARICGAELATQNGPANARPER